MQEIPKYDGSQCTSSCGNDYDCPHSDEFDFINGIRRSVIDFDVKHDKQTYQIRINKQPTDEEVQQWAYWQAEQEQKWGEERSANEN